MNKRRALILGSIGFLIIILLLLLSSGFFVSQGNSPVKGYLSISKKTPCSSDPQDVRFSKNPPYFVGEKYYWWIKVTVKAMGNVSDVVVSDQLGEELMIEGVSFVAIEKPGPYNYTFNYDVYEAGGGVTVSDGVTLWTGFLNEAGVVFEDFFVYWSGDSLEAHIEWMLGSMKEGDCESLFVTISTDLNSDGQQEFTSPGLYLLNSGATVEGILESTGQQTIAESNVIEIEVFEKAD